MKFGMPSLVELDTVEEQVKEAAKRGLDFVELNQSFPTYRADILDPGELIALSEKYGVGYTFHADEQMDPMNFDRRIAAVYTDIMRESIRFAKAVNAPVINLHLLKGVYVTLTDRVILLTDVYRGEYLRAVKSFIRACEEEIGDAPLVIAIENVDSNPFTKSQLEALELFLASPVFRLTLDVGHDTCLGGKDFPVYQKHPDKLVHMHLHDSDGGKRAHLALGDGIVDVKDRLSLMPQDATVLIEVKTLEGLDKSLQKLAELGIREERKNV